MPKAGVAGRDASVGPARLTQTQTRSSQAPQMVTVGPGGPVAAREEGAGERQNGIRARWSEARCGVIHCRRVRGGP